MVKLNLFTFYRTKWVIGVPCCITLLKAGIKQASKSLKLLWGAKSDRMLQLIDNTDFRRETWIPGVEAQAVTAEGVVMVEKNRKTWQKPSDAHL